MYDAGKITWAFSASACHQQNGDINGKSVVWLKRDKLSTGNTEQWLTRALKSDLSEFKSELSYLLIP
jgi:hypothetical protein